MSIQYYPLINKVMTTLRLRDDAPKVPNGDHDLETDSFIKPFITVARQPGSGGKPIAQAVADKLNYTFVDEQIVEAIAHSTKRRKAVIKAVDEKARTAIEDIVHSLLNQEYVNDVKYLTEMTKIVLSYAHQGHVVILGRGANFITPFAKGLHVNVIAPYKTRVERAMEFEGHSREMAREVIADVTKEREEFVKKYLRKNLNKRDAYDLTLNTKHFRVDEARDIIIEAFYRKFSRSKRYGALVK